MNQLDFAQPPFDVLTPAERQSLKKHTQVRYLARDTFLTPEDLQHFYVVLKGQIIQTLDDDYVGDFNASATSHDWFDARRLPDRHQPQDHIPDASSATDNYHYRASDDTLLLQVAADAIDRIAAQNHHVRQLLSGELSERMQALSQRRHTGISSGRARQAEAQQLMLQPITQIPLLDVVIIEDTASLFDAAKLMTQAGLKHVLLKRSWSAERHPTKAHHTELGILTDTDICRAIAEGRDPATTLCQDYGKFKLRTIASHHDVSDALLTMIRYRVHRLPVVNESGQIQGVLGQTDLLAYLSHHSQLITVQIEQASDVNSLHQAVEQIGQYIRAQHQNGIKVGVISRMVQTLNAQVFSKLWRLIVPDMVYENTCVIVMGSEGRGEQIMRTDQDNALIIRNGFSHPELADFADRFNQSLAQMGYPLCDGNIMMTNPMWRQSLSRFQAQVSSWFNNKEPIHSIWLSAVLDAAYVCGDETLLHSLREHLRIAHDNADPMFIRQFARAALQFGEVSQWWQKFAPLIGKPANQDIDLKKAGLFPLVHGIRSLALEHNILDVTSTKARLKALSRTDAMTAKRAEALNEALEFFMGQRLAVALITEDKHARQVDPTTLSALERDLLKECLNMVKSFKQELRQHYHLEVN